MQLAAQLGINAVPFFVINDKYGISGAQQPELFLEALEKLGKSFLMVTKVYNSSILENLVTLMEIAIKIKKRTLNSSLLFLKSIVKY